MKIKKKKCKFVPDVSLLWNQKRIFITQIIYILPPEINATGLVLYQEIIFSQQIPYICSHGLILKYVLALNNQKYIKMILDTLPSLAGQRWKVIAILTGKKPISIATNNPHKSHPLVDKHNSNRRVHAEIRCLRNAPAEKIRDSTMYIFRSSNGSFKLAKPCFMCMSYLQEMGVKKIIYSTDTGTETMRVQLFNSLRKS